MLDKCSYENNRGAFVDGLGLRATTTITSKQFNFNFNLLLDGKRNPPALL